jgi:hypothetical protein
MIGYGVIGHSKPANATPGSTHAEGVAEVGSAVAFQLSGHCLGPPSLCQPFEDVIKQKLDQNLPGQRIWQDLVEEYGITGFCSSVRRFVRGLHRGFFC